MCCPTDPLGSAPPCAPLPPSISLQGLRPCFSSYCAQTFLPEGVLTVSSSPTQDTHPAISAELWANLSKFFPSPSSSSPVEASVNGDLIGQGCMRDFSMVEADEGTEAGEFPSPAACLSLPLLHTCTIPWPCLGHHVSLG